MPNARTAGPPRRAARLRGGARAALLSLFAIGAALPACPAVAQQVYRSVDAQGRPVFSDRDLGRDARDTGIAATATGTGAAGRDALLPYELRQTAQRYPVVFYSSADCGAPCSAARQLLSERGVPYVERTVGTAEDIRALQRISGGSSLPFATIGRQSLTGFSSAEWNQYLDAAQYPRRSELPAGYRQPAPTPLVAAAPARGAGPGANSAPASAPAAPPAAQGAGGAAPGNPAGIRF
ncbi:MAG: DUF4124 domain-containing protein [Xylophilus ampelinus]